MPLKTYNPDECDVIVAGIPLQGYADGEFINVEQEANDFEDVVGTDGEVTRSKTNDRRATVTVFLMQSSSANDQLSVLSNIDRNGPNGSGVGAFLLKDRSGRLLLEAAECWIQKPPTVSLDRTPTPREWVLRCANLVRFDGGN